MEVRSNTVGFIPSIGGSGFAIGSRSRWVSAPGKCLAAKPRAVEVGRVGRRARAVVLAQKSLSEDIYIERSDDYEELTDCAGFFVDAFWSASTTATVLDGIGEGGLNKKAYRQLREKQIDDLAARYGKLMGKRRLESSFFIARGLHDKIMGCVGVEVAVVKEVDGQYEVLTREEGEQLFNSTLGSMPAVTRNALRKAPLSEVSDIVFNAQSEGSGVKYSLHPVLSNLVVRPEARGSGLGELLCLTCEDAVRSYNQGMFEDIWLIVEELNDPARRLYEKIGYRLLWKNPNASVIRPTVTEEGLKVIGVTATHLLFTKSMD